MNQIAFSMYAYLSFEVKRSRFGVLLVYQFSFCPFYIDLWIVVLYIDSNGYMNLMNVMCDMSQFVVVVSVSNESSTMLASYFT